MRALALITFTLLLSARARADEGLWTFNNFPTDKVQASYGFAPDRAWLDRVQATTVVMGRCSGTFVSPNGLVLLHRDCITSCLGMQAAVKRSQALFGEACRDKALRRGLPLFDLLYCARLDRQEQRLAERASFLARTPAEEVRCTNRGLRQLVSVEDVTERMNRAADSSGNVLEAIRAERRKLQQECGLSDVVECEVVGLYDNARWELHRYKYFRDVRLVFSPEVSVAEFGVEDSPLAFPQHRFPAAVVRVYEAGKPARTPFLKLAESAPREGALVFLSGFVPPTARRSSVASIQLSQESNTFSLPFTTEVRGIVYEYGKHKLDPARAAAVNRELDSAVHSMRTRLDAITPELLARAQARETLVRARIDADPRLRDQYGRAWDDEERLMQQYVRNLRRNLLVETSNCGALYGMARELVRAADERAKPSAQRMEMFTDARLPQTERFLLRPIAFDEDSETEILSFCYRTFKRELGPAHPLFKKMLQGEAPDEAARRMHRQSSLLKLSVRRALWQGGRAAIDASTEPLVVMWRRIAADVRAARQRFEDEIQKPLTAADKLIGRARFAVFGTSEYPDGNATMRLRYGKVAGYTSPEGALITPFVPLSAMFAAATGKPPFELPPRWLDARPRLDLAMPLAFAASADVIISATGSEDVGAALIDRDLRVLGMTFGGNEAAAGCLFDYKPETRAVVLASPAILHILARVYGAEALVRELR